jgi:hypothetical protein
VPKETEAPRHAQPLVRGTGFATIVTFIKANKELLAVAGSALTGLFGAIAWAFAYFATQEQLSRLECTMGSNLLLQVLPAEISVDTLKLEQRHLELVKIRSASLSGDEVIVTLQRLEDEIQNLQAERERYNKTYTDVLARVGSSDCLHNREQSDKEKKS